MVLASTILIAIFAVAIAVLIQQNNAASSYQDVAQKLKHYVCTDHSTSCDGIKNTNSSGSDVPQDVVKGGHDATSASLAETQEHLALTYFRQPERVVQLISDCVIDEQCHLVFLHVPKTGGSTVEYQFYKLFPPAQLSDPNIVHKSGSCCHNTMMRRFDADKAAHCYAKFSSFTVSIQQFRGVLDECRAFLNDEEQLSHAPKPHRFIGLFSFREPHSRIISSIHEICNFHYGRWDIIKNKMCREDGEHPEDMGPICSGILSDLVEEACNTCDYAQHPSYWNLYLEELSSTYRNLLHLSHVKLPQTEIMSVDVGDLNLFFGHLKASLPEQYHDKFQPNTRVNSETTSDHCNFGMTSETFRRLEHTSKVYRNLTLGL